MFFNRQFLLELGIVLLTSEFKAFSLRSFLKIEMKNGSYLAIHTFVNILTFDLNREKSDLKSI